MLHRFILLTLILSPYSLPAQPIAFSGAEGFGALATGGRGGQIVHVTNLSDAGEGSFRDAVATPKRIVLFDVCGTINLKSGLSISSDITIAGQSSPGEGICVYGNPVSLSESKNVIIRYLRFREGINGPKGKCSINLNKGQNVIIDHCSIEWGRWDCLGVTESSTVTIQNCMIGEGIGPQRFGCLCETDDITFARNLWISNQSRNPKSKGRVQYINNVVYNWGVTGLVGGHSGADHWLDLIGNYFIKGPNSNNSFVGQFAPTDKVFQSDNFFDEDKDGKLHGREAIAADFGREQNAASLIAKPTLNPAVPVKILSAQAACEYVLANAGASLKRDAVDRRLIEEARSLGAAGKLIKEESEAGGPCEIPSADAPIDSDHDGIPDQWETAHQLNPNDPADALAHIEAYLDSLVSQ